MIDEAEAERELTPIMRAIGDPAGIPLEVDGQTWLLAHGGAAPILDPYRNRMDDQVRLAGQVEMADVYEAARLMLLSNYELADLEILQLFAGANRKALAEATMAAMFGPPNPHLTYTHWMRSSLYANGIDPEWVPAEWLPYVLDQLVQTNRAVPVTKYTDAALAAPKLAAIRAKAEQAAKEKAKKEAASAANLPAPPEVPAPPVAVQPEQPT